MLKQIKLREILLSSVLLLGSNNALAHNCGNVQGEYFTNPNGQKGGFVEQTAYVDKNNSKIFINSEASVCEYAQVFGGKIIGSATLTGDHIMKDGMVGGTAILSSGINNGAKFLENSQQIGGKAHSWQKFTDGYIYSGETSMQKAKTFGYEKTGRKRDTQVYTAPNNTTKKQKQNEQLISLQAEAKELGENLAQLRDNNQNNETQFQKENRKLQQTTRTTFEQIRELEEELGITQAKEMSEPELDISTLEQCRTKYHPIIEQSNFRTETKQKEIEINMKNGGQILAKYFTISEKGIPERNNFTGEFKFENNHESTVTDLQIESEITNELIDTKFSYTNCLRAATNNTELSEVDKKIIEEAKKPKSIFTSLRLDAGLTTYFKQSEHNKQLAEKYGNRLTNNLDRLDQTNAPEKQKVKVKTGFNSIIVGSQK